MKTFKQYITEDKQKYIGNYSWYKEAILKNDYTTASSPEEAHRNFCSRIAAKVKRSVPSVMSYFKNTPNSYTIKKG